MYSPCEQIIDIYAEKNIKEFIEFIECKRIGKNSSDTQNNTAEWNLNLYSGVVLVELHLQKFEFIRTFRV